MKTSTKVILGVCGAFVGAWLAGSAYFLANGRDEELEEGLLQFEEPLPREENAYSLSRSCTSCIRRITISPLQTIS